MFTVLLVYWPFGNLHLWNVWPCLCLFIKCGLNYIIVIDFRNSLYICCDKHCNSPAFLKDFFTQLLRQLSTDSLCCQILQKLPQLYRSISFKIMLILEMGHFQRLFDVGVYSRGNFESPALSIKPYNTLVTDFSSTSFSSSPCFLLFLSTSINPKDVP